MRTAATAGAIAAAMLVQPASPGSIHTVAQRDAGRVPLDPSSASVSADGRYIAFTSYAALDAADVDDRRDVYVLDRASGLVTLESTAGATPEETDNRHPRLSADGRTIVYERVFPSRSEIVRLDRRGGSATVVTQGVRGTKPDGFSSSPEISHDGRLVVFSSNATNLVHEYDANGAGEDIYRYSHVSGAIDRISIGNGQQSAGGSSVSPSISADGRYIAFASSADLLGRVRTGPRLPWYEVFLLETTTRNITLVSRGLNGVPADGGSWSPALSGDGRFVAFVSSAKNLVADDRNNVWDVFVADLRAERIELVSRTPAGAAANGRSAVPAISQDGQFVAFQSEASDMLCHRRCTAASEDINLLWDVFVADRRNGTMRWVSRVSAREWMEPSGGPAMDAAGTVVVFSSRHPIDAADRANDFDLFICAPRLGRR